MLTQRILTAVALLLVLLPALFHHSPLPFCALTILLIAAAAWEWARLNGYGSALSVSAGGGMALACGGAWWLGLLEQPLIATTFWIVGGAAWVLAGAWVLYRGVGSWSTHPACVRLMAGLSILWFAWLALAQARVIGVNFLLSILMLVWVADIGAYFAGKALGGRIWSVKLAPSISPGKSWEGVLGGMAGVLTLAWGWQRFDLSFGPAVPSLYSYLGLQSEWLLLIAVVFLTAMSVVGDLFESLVKRSAGVKDSSGLLPGHGGVLDRVDALLPVLPLAMMLYSVGKFG